VGELPGGAGQLGVDAALAEQLLRVGLLEVVAADLGGRDVSGDRQHRHSAAVGVEQSIDQMQVARTAAGGADRQLAGDRGLAGCGERGRLLVTDVLPRQAAVAAQGVGEAVQGVAR
jgi:hypothetical protein